MVRLEFTYFQVAWDALCERDYVKITDGNGSTLMESSCGWSQGIHDSHTYYFMPPILVSLTNSVEILFVTDYGSQGNGWSLSWTAVTPGLFLFVQLLTISLMGHPLVIVIVCNAHCACSRQPSNVTQCGCKRCDTLFDDRLKLTQIFCQEPAPLSRSHPLSESPALCLEPSTASKRAWLTKETDI